VQRPRPPEISSVAKEKSYNKKLIVDGSMPSGSQPTVVSLTPIPSWHSATSCRGARVWDMNRMMTDFVKKTRLCRSTIRRRTQQRWIA